MNTNVIEAIKTSVEKERAAAAKFYAEMENKIKVWAIIAEAAPLLPIAPTMVVGSKLYGCVASVHFHIDNCDKAVQWRELTALTMETFRPCPLYRETLNSVESRPDQSDKCPPDKRREIEPFTVRMHRMFARGCCLYGTTVAIEWYAETNIGRLHFCVTLASDQGHAGHAAGFELDPLWSSGRHNRVPVSYNAKWPFDTHSVQRYLSSGHSSNYHVAWWPIGTATKANRAAAFLELTAPKEEG